jgi:hypothetical protein
VLEIRLHLRLSPDLVRARAFEATGIAKDFDLPAQVRIDSRRARRASAMAWGAVAGDPDW